MGKNLETTGEKSEKREGRKLPAGEEERRKKRKKKGGRQGRKGRRRSI